MIGSLAALAACAGDLQRPHSAGSVGSVEPTAPSPPVDAAPATSSGRVRLVPASLLEARFWGAEPSGAERALVAGVRILAGPNETVLEAAERLPAAISSVTALPGRLGGGFLFASGKQVWRAERWLDPAVPIYSGPTAIDQVLLGLDRVYLRTSQGALSAIDARTGAGRDLGALPSSPHFGRVVAWDAWRAFATADLRGALVTSDAGETWQPVALPIEPSEVVARADGFAVVGTDPSRNLQRWLVRFDGRSEPLAAPTEDAEEPPPLLARGAEARKFGPSPLLSAMLDGWPAGDGTAWVARAGALARVRLGDGRLLSVVPDAFPPAVGRCRAISLGTPSDRVAFGFVCGETSGETRIFRWDAARARVAEVQRFSAPRQVLGFDNGALAARGPCPDHPPAVLPRVAKGPDEQAWCTQNANGPWRELIVRGANAERVKPVVLASGATLLIRPPEAADLSTAALVLPRASGEITVPLRFPVLRPDVVRALRYGIWMDGFEERRPGVVGGWIDAAGSVLGIEIAQDGEARLGEYIRDAGSPVVSGRWGFGWTASRGGFETTDGGMTWRKEMALPDPISEPASGRPRACGPMGCVLAGWMRIGWGPPPELQALNPPPPPSGHWVPRRPLELECEAANATALPSSRASSPSTVVLTAEVAGGLDRGLRALTPARVAAWGPANGPWDAFGRWEVLWDSPWGNSGPARASAVASSPWPDVDSARRALGIAPSPPLSLALVSGDDAAHALLVGRRSAPNTAADIVVLEAGRLPARVRRIDDAGVPEVQAALRAFGRWFLATGAPSGESAASVLWQVDGAVAREVARWPRSGAESAAALRVRLAERAESRGLGLVVEGQPDRTQPPFLWVSTFDPETGERGEPVRLAPLDLADRPIPFCTGDDSGWQVDLPYPSAVRIRAGDRIRGGLASPLARLRVSVDHACLEALVGAYDGGASPGFATDSVPVAPSSRTHPERRIDVSAYVARSRLALRCRLAE